MNDPAEECDYLRLTLSPPGQQSVAYHNHSHARDAVPSASSSSSTQQERVLDTNAGGSYGHGSNEGGAAGPARRVRRGGSGGERGCPARPKEERITAAYPWATDRRAVVHSLDYLLANGILAIRGDLVCKRCDGKETREVDMQSSFLPLSNFFLSSKDTMHDRAPKVWMVPRLLDCNLCHQADCVKPVIDEKKRRINWLFLLLTQTLGLCTLDQLKYFCKHTKKHRTGAKDRVLYLTYVGLLKQLNPSGPYD